MSGFSSVAGLDATHRKPLTQLLPWLLQSLRPLNSSHFFQLCNKTSMKAFVSYHPTGSRRVPLPSPYKKKAAIDFLIHRQALGIKPSCLSRNFCGPSGFYSSPLHTFLTRIMWELKLFMNTNQARRNQLNMGCFYFKIYNQIQVNSTSNGQLASRSPACF